MKKLSKLVPFVIRMKGTFDAAQEVEEESMPMEVPC